MIISRTPFRISFFGGGTDFPGYFNEYGGAVISSSIDKYCYLSVHRLTSLFKYRCRASYSRTELVMSSKEFEHPLIRETLAHLGIDSGVEIVHFSDLPGQTGLGSSSSFTVGLLNALHAFHGKLTAPETLASDAVYIERTMVGDPGGWQDQHSAAFGGLNIITFSRDGQVNVKRLNLPCGRIEELEKHLMLFYMGTESSAETILREQISNTGNNVQALKQMRAMVTDAEQLLRGNGRIGLFGEMLHETWIRKRELSTGISNPTIDNAYDVATSAGATGGKLLGAGGRGFFLIFAEPKTQPRIREKLKGLQEVPFSFSENGSSIIFSDNE